MKLIPLSSSQFAKVDDWWFEYLNQWIWTAQWAEHIQGYYAQRSEGPRNNSKVIMMHRVVAKTPDGMICDHINHETLNNQEHELRNVTRSQSQMNIGVMKNNKLGVKGVTKRTNRDRYIATLYLDKKLVFKKEFKTIEEAKQAREKAEIKYFGEFRKK